MNRRTALLFCLALLLPTPGAPAAGEPPVSELQAHLDALKNVKTLTASFICEKRLKLLDSPLVSSGQVSIRKAEDGNRPGRAGGGGGRGGGGAVRFSTQRPYLSELILIDGKVHGRSQHETQWTTASQAARPGLSAVMVQLGGWSTGDAGTLADMYSLARAPSAVPPPPQGAVPGPRPAIKTGRDGIDTYLLTPTHKDLAIAIKSIELAFDQASHQLLSIQITTAQDDVTRYWFFDVQLDPPLGPQVFSPTPEGGGTGRGDSR